VLDAQLPEALAQSRERRRRERTERNRTGETLVGLGVIAMAAALIGRDTWRFGTVTVLAGAVLLSVGAYLNRAYLGELFRFRGASRRGEKRSEPRAAGSAPRPNGRASTVTPAVMPGLADRPAPRESGKLRGDRETPIMTAKDDDSTQDGPSRVRIR
jgi:hypothetical protein